MCEIPCNLLWIKRGTKKLVVHLKFRGFALIKIKLSAIDSKNKKENVGFPTELSKGKQE